MELLVKFSSPSLHHSLHISTLICSLRCPRILSFLKLPFFQIFSIRTDKVHSASVNMQFSQAAFILAYLAALSTAAPVSEPISAPASILESRQSVRITENEYTIYGCRPVIFFFARGSSEVGNMVWNPLATP